VAGPEAKIRGRVCELMRLNGWHATPVDNESCWPGTADVHYLSQVRLGHHQQILTGWTELKQLAAWPKRANTTVLLPKFTPQQRSWLRSYWETGGGSSLLLRVGDARTGEWLLFRGDVASDAVGYRTQAELRALTCAPGLRGPLKFTWLAEALVELRS
jgi:hypothetical protein